MTESSAVIPWRWVSPLEEVNGTVVPLLETVDTLRRAWVEFVESVSPEDFIEARRRSLRRHAIETGIIERLYDVSWGVTEALVAEGLTRDVAEREDGAIDEDSLTTIRTQFEALEFLASAAREGRDVSVGSIRELHAAITRNQRTYEARDAQGQLVERQLHHGTWKTWPNHVVRPDGTLLQYTPHEHVAAEMARLVELYADTAEAHPVVRAAWLHHRFICVHPFEDGNGRVARALVLLVLLRADYAPLVVDRNRREEYIAALDAANDGDLAPLVRFFAGLEIVALRSEFEQPAMVTHVGSGPLEVARGYAERLRKIKIGTDESRAAAVASLASDLQARLEEQLQRLAGGLKSAFVALDPSAHCSVATAAPPNPHARYWHAQLVRAARTANFFTNLSDGSWWVRLRLLIFDQEMRFVVSVQKVGQGETGVLAVTVFSELVLPQGDADEPRSLPVALFTPTTEDSVTLGTSDTVEARWPEVCELVERTLAASVDEFGKQLG